eukprot:c9738_g1_i1 orf=509-2698(+)
MGQHGMPPGFRFSPTDEELVMHYLKNRACGKDFHQGVIAEINIYKHEPWDLPEKAALPSHDPVWYFFNAQDKRQPHTARVNRITSKGYWKATGKDRKICCGPHTVGIKKTLIYYEGRAPSGKRTDWIMHEYKLDDEFEKRSKVVCATALCRIRKKGGPGPRNGEQFGAPILHENEWGEDVEDDVDEKPPVPSKNRYEPSACSIPDQCKGPNVQVEKVLQGQSTEDCGSNDVSHAEGLDITEEELCAFLESFLPNDTEVTSLGPEMVSSVPGLDKTYIDNHHVDCDTNADLYALQDIQSLFDLDGKHMDDILHPTYGEEQILGELLHLADGGHGDCSTMILSPPHVHNGGILYGDDVGPSGVTSGFIELDDMNFPLDGFVMRSPLQGSDDNVHDEEQQPFALFDGVETFSWASDLLHTQGSATRRARLQITPPSVNRRHVDSSQQIEAVHNSHPEVQRQEVSSDTILQIVSGTFEDGQKFNSTSGSCSNMDEIANVVKSSPESFMFKQTSFYTVAKCAEMLPHTVCTATTESQDEECPALKKVTSSTALIDQSKVQRATLEDCILPVNALSSEPLCLPNTSSSTQDAGPDPTNGSMSKHVNSRTCVGKAGGDCEALFDPPVIRGAKAKDSNTVSAQGNSVIGQLVSKAKSLTLGSRMVQLDSTLTTTFNDKVFSLGKPVAQLLPSNVNPYHSLRRGAMASLSRLVLAVLLLVFLFCGIHMLTKYVLSRAV